MDEPAVNETTADAPGASAEQDEPLDTADAPPTSDADPVAADDDDNDDSALQVDKDPVGEDEVFEPSQESPTAAADDARDQEPDQEPDQEELDHEEDTDQYQVNLDATQRSHNPEDMDNELADMFGHLGPQSPQELPSDMMDHSPREQEHSAMDQMTQDQIDRCRGDQEELRAQIEECHRQEHELQSQVEELQRDGSRSDQELETQMADLDALCQQEREQVNKLKGLIREEKRNGSKLGPGGQEVLDKYNFELEMKKSAEQAKQAFMEQHAQVHSQNMHLQAEMGNLRRQIEMAEQGKQRGLDARRLARQKLAHATNEYHELAVKIKETVKAKYEVPKITAITKQQELAVLQQKAEWQPKMLMMDLARKQAQCSASEQAEDEQRKLLQQTQADLALAVDRLLASVNAANLMHSQIVDTEKMQVSHPEAIALLSRLHKRTKSELEEQLRGLEDKHAQVRLPDLALLPTPPGEAKALDKAIERAKKKFVQMDGNKDGALDVKEMRGLVDWVWGHCQPGGEPMPEEAKATEAQKLLNRLDKGSKDAKIDFQEFEGWFRRTCRGIERSYRIEAQKAQSDQEAERAIQAMCEIPEQEADAIEDKVQQQLKHALRMEESRWAEEKAMLKQTRIEFEQQRKNQTPSSDEKRPHGKMRTLSPPHGAPSPGSQRRSQAAVKEPNEAFELAMFGANLGFQDFIAQGEAELATMREAELQGKILAKLKQPTAAEIEKAGTPMLAGTTLQDKAQTKVAKALEDFKYADEPAEVNLARDKVFKAKGSLKAAQEAENLLGEKAAATLLFPEKRERALQVLLDAVSCTSKDKLEAAQTALQILGTLPKNVSSASEARKVVHVLLQRVAEHGPLEQDCMQTLSRVATAKPALSSFCDCFKSSHHAKTRGARPVDGKAAPDVASVAARVVAEQLRKLGGKVPAWVGEQMETLVRAVMEGLAHEDVNTKEACRDIVQVLRQQIPKELTRIAERCAPGTGAGIIQQALTTSH